MEFAFSEAAATERSTERSNEGAAGTAEDLLRTVVELAGIPQDSAPGILEELRQHAPASPSSVGLEDLRSILLSYLEAVHQEIEAAGEAGSPEAPSELHPPL